ncbi:cas scaffolding protein family member 4 isoform X1 [Anguilla anguilla]|uniref:cas scaffolding protein family member 4 isoform X1 n=1 Tax=Anguilla anguilla TaxID=7936 RepID=UPI0015B02475|nr:cas scaffolding protein family member 4 isoform X1 [Anguilla anguilla]
MELSTHTQTKQLKSGKRKKESSFRAGECRSRQSELTSASSRQSFTPRPGSSAPRTAMFQPLAWESWLDSLFTKKIKNILAKALYDNTAECEDELAFRKGDIITVMEQNVSGSHGWWKCSLHGRQGFAPANRLHLLSPAQAEGLYRGAVVGCLTLCAEKPPSDTAPRCDSPQNIYQIPSVPRQIPGPTYECMDRIYKVPSTPQPAPKGPTPTSQMHTQERNPSPCLVSAAGGSCSPRSEVYDVPTCARRVSLFSVSPNRPMTRKSSLVTTSELQQKRDAGWMKCSNSQATVHAIPPALSQDPSYDIPMASTAEAQQRLACGYNTLPNPRKSDWIYDVPVSPEKPGQEQASYGTLPSQVASPERQLYDTLPSRAAIAGRQLYDTLPARVWPVQSCSSALSLYDIPKPSSPLRPAQELPGGLPCAEPGVSVYATPPGAKQPESSVRSVPLVSQEQPSSQCPRDFMRGHVPPERRGMARPTYDHPHGRQLRDRISVGVGSLHRGPASRESLRKDKEDQDERDSISSLSARDSQRSSTASSSSSSSYDSLALSCSSPEPQREVSLSQEEASQRLVELQEAVCQAVPRLMVFVSSSWRSREHLGQHLSEIRAAVESISAAIVQFLDFALDVRGNARRLTDSNLQVRLHKQLSILEDSGLILQQAKESLDGGGWQLDALSQEPSQMQTPDQLERFVMVARTVPEDVKRLVSILNANGKLLFRPIQRDADPSGGENQMEAKKSPVKNRQVGDPGAEDNDYVQLQTKKEFELQQNSKQEDKNIALNGTSPQKPSVKHKKAPPPPPVRANNSRMQSLSEYLRLYFGALQKAITVFVMGLQEGQPPEKFIAHSKLVIMVGQKLVDTLCREAQSGQASQDLLCKSNHLCALLKQLAVATKKAALHFPDKQALQEAQDLSKELAQQAQHFRTSLDL